MRRALSFLFLFPIAGVLVLLSCRTEPQPDQQQSSPPGSYLGFDRNIFPGATALPVLRKTFAFSGYWLSAPPGETTNTWLGHRELLRSQGFGFLLLYRGPLSRELKSGPTAADRGTLDARTAASSASSEGFPAKSILFLDIEEGGRLPPAYHEYLRGWATELLRNGYRPGAYCSGMPVKEEPGATIVTADDIRAHLPSQDFSFFIFNDACPPSPGCGFPQHPPSPASGGVAFAAVWQFVRSPRTEYSAHCPPGYHTDGNCYAPSDTARAWFLDVSSAASPDPSSAR